MRLDERRENASQLPSVGCLCTNYKDTLGYRSTLNSCMGILKQGSIHAFRLLPAKFSSAKIRKTNRTANFWNLISEIVVTGDHLLKQV